MKQGGLLPSTDMQFVRLPGGEPEPKTGRASPRG